MTAFIKQTPCDCPCGATPCAPACECDITVSHDDGAGGDTTVDVTGQFYIEHDLAISVTGGTCNKFVVCGGGAGAPETWRTRVYADAVLIFDSGCTTGNLSTTVAVPAGTTEVRCVTDVDCDNCCESDSNGTLAYYDCPAV